jgi:hypothetical protein
MNIASALLVASLFASPEPPGIPEPPEVELPPAEATCGGSPSLEFVEPADGAMVDSPVTVSFIVRTACNCDDGGCYDGGLANLTLNANGVDNPVMGDSIELELPPGEHVLTLSGEADFHTETAMITITVKSPPEEQGCAIEQPSERRASTLGLLLLLGISARRYRRYR